MKLSHLTTSILAITALTLSAGCSGQVNADPANPAARMAQKVDDHSDHDHEGKEAQKPSAPGADISGIAAGTYKSEATAMPILPSNICIRAIRARLCAGTILKRRLLLIPQIQLPRP